MQRLDDQAIETFIAEDLLIALGAIRMALRWTASDATQGAGTGLTHLEGEIDALTGRAKAIYRDLRVNSVRAPGPVAPVDDALAAILPLAVPTPVEAEPRAPGGPGLPPMWLAEIESLDAPGDAQGDPPDPEPAPQTNTGPPVPAPQGDIENAFADLGPDEATPEDLSDSIDELLASAMGSDGDDAVDDPEPRRA